MKVNRLKRVHLTKKKLIILSSSALLGILILGYVGYSLSSWQGYEDGYKATQTQTKRDLDVAIALPMTSIAEREQKLTKLEKASADLAKKQQSLCVVSPVTQWQAVVVGVKAKQTACQAVRDKNNTLVRALDETIAYLDGERILAVQLGTVTGQPTQSDESNWAQAAALWAKLVIDTAAAKPDLAFQPTQTVAMTAIKGVDGAWQELISAHTAADKTRFVKAQAGLVASYDALASITDENNKQMTALDQTLSRAYTAAF